MKDNRPGMQGGFTLPGEAGYEALTLELAERWGADVIRDSDGTALSPQILDAGYDIYSTICPIRNHNAWIAANPHARQQSFLCSRPQVAQGDTLTLSPMEGFFTGQFALNDDADALPYWQVYDRTTGEPLLRKKWRYDADMHTVQIDAIPFHRYTVSFLAWRIWEEISMYNHVTNGWTSEHLLQLDPYHPDAEAYMCAWLARWCEEHPQTSVVRFTSLFYNFAWIWGEDARNRSIFTDWASYDFTVSPRALADFEQAYGYPLTAEDFVRGGKYFATHCPPSGHKRDWMAFIGAFVRRVGRRCVDIVHQSGKKAYVFYDDSWVGLEPYSGHFEEFGFDGMIKCVFSGYEARLCAGVPTGVHEIRFHPYLFPVGLGGAPTFSPGGKPGRDALRYWVNVRRALLRQRIERAGLGGYLHLVKEYPDFVEAMDTILAEFRAIGQLHDADAPATLPLRIGVLHAWGALRTWTLSGHFHETEGHVLIHVLESLSGLPVDVRFLSFDDLKDGVPEGLDVILNAGEAGSAWSGAEAWQEVSVVTHLTKWVHEGGVFLGIDAPSATPGGDHLLRMAHVLGVDLDTGEYSCHGRWPVEATTVDGLVPQGASLPAKPELFLIDGETRVLMAQDGMAVATQRICGKGMGLYLSGYRIGEENTRLLLNLLLHATGGVSQAEGISDNLHTEVAIYPEAGKAAVINNTDEPQRTAFTCQGENYTVELPPYGMQVVTLPNR